MNSCNVRKLVLYFLSCLICMSQPLQAQSGSQKSAVYISPTFAVGGATQFSDNQAALLYGIGVEYVPAPRDWSIEGLASIVQTGCDCFDSGDPITEHVAEVWVRRSYSRRHDTWGPYLGGGFGVLTSNSDGFAVTEGFVAGTNVGRNPLGLRLEARAQIRRRSAYFWVMAALRVGSAFQRHTPQR